MYDRLRMNHIEEKYLRSIVGEETIRKLKKYARIMKVSQDDDVMENSMWSNMIDGALKALEAVSILSLDWKLIGIVKLLQSWIKDKREEKKKKKMEEQYGVGYQPPGATTTYDPWGGTTY